MPQGLAAQFFVMPHGKMTCLDLSGSLADIATLQEAHKLLGKDWWTWAPGPARLRQHSESLLVKIKAAETKDTEKVKELEEEHQDALLSITVNANCIVMRAMYEKNEEYLYNCGYVLKDHGKKIQTPTGLRRTPQVLTAKDGSDPTTAIVTFQRDPAAGLYQLMFCKGKPEGLESYQEHGKHKGVRVVLRDLERASWYYFIGRSLGDNEEGPWSEPVGIIVT